MTPDAANTVFAAAEFTPRGQDDARLLIIDAQARIVYATQDALELFGAKDRSDLQDRLLAGEGPTARRLRHLTTSLPIGEAPRLERLRFFSDAPAGERQFALRPHPASGMAAHIWLFGRRPRARGATRCARSTSRARMRAPRTRLAPTRRPSTKPSPKSRFLWSLDKEGRFGAADPVLTTALGANAPLPGETLEALRLRTGLKHGDDLVRAIEERETFSDVPVDWPSAKENIRFRMRLSATPVFGRGREFVGFRAFGRLDEAVSMVDGRATAGAAAFVDIAERDTSANAFVVPAAEETAEVTAAVPAGAAPADPGQADDLADGSGLAPALPESADEDGAGSETSLDADARPSDETPQGARAEDARSNAPGDAANAPPERTAEIYVLRQTHAATSKIVPIRPGALEALALDPGQGSGGDSVELSKSERDAFREIARALIGRTHNAPTDAGPDGSTLVEIRRSVWPRPSARRPRRPGLLKPGSATRPRRRLNRPGATPGRSSIDCRSACSSPETLRRSI